MEVDCEDHLPPLPSSGKLVLVKDDSGSDDNLPQIAKSPEDEKTRAPQRPRKRKRKEMANDKDCSGESSKTSSSSKKKRKSESKKPRKRRTPMQTKVKSKMRRLSKKNKLRKDNIFSASVQRSPEKPEATPNTDAHSIAKHLDPEVYKNEKIDFIQATIDEAIETQFSFPEEILPPFNTEQSEKQQTVAPEKINIANQDHSKAKNAEESKDKSRLNDVTAKRREKKRTKLIESEKQMEKTTKRRREGKAEKATKKKKSASLMDDSGSMETYIRRNTAWKQKMDVAIKTSRSLMEKCEKEKVEFERTTKPIMNADRMIAALDKMIYPNRKELREHIRAELKMSEEEQIVVAELNRSFDPDCAESEFDNLTLSDKRMLLSMYLVYTEQLQPGLAKLRAVLKKLMNDNKAMRNSVKSLRSSFDTLSTSNEKFVNSMLAKMQEKSTDRLHQTQIASGVQQTHPSVFLPFVFNASGISGGAVSRTMDMSRFS